MTDADQIRANRAVRSRGLGVVLGWHVLLVAAYLVWTFLQPAQHSPDSCDGLGWGCTPNPRDAALIVGIIYGAPAVSIMALVSALLTAVLAFRLRPGWKAGTAGTFITWLVAVGALLVWYRNLG